MLRVYETISFTKPAPFTREWHNQFKITYDKEKIMNEKRLEVIVVPHSHVDAGSFLKFGTNNQNFNEMSRFRKFFDIIKNFEYFGNLKKISKQNLGWLKTFDEYYDLYTRATLSLMVDHLNNKNDLKFIFAEMCFFEKWWAEQGEVTRINVKE